MKENIIKSWNKAYDKCPICNSKEIIYNYLETTDRVYFSTNQRFNLSKCKNCGVIFLNPSIKESELNNLYPKESYYAYKDFKKFKRKKKNKLKLLYKRYFYPEIKFFRKGRILDFGCGSGDKMVEFANLGLDCYGVDVDQKAVKIGKSYGLNIRNGDLIDINFDAKSFDYIYARHSIEHLLFPHRIISEFYRILNDNGKLFIEVPNTKSLTYYLYGKYWYYLTIPFHPFNYSLKSLRILLESNNFYINKITYKGTSGGFLNSKQILHNAKNNINKPPQKNKNEFYSFSYTFLALFANIIRLGDCIFIEATKRK